MTPVFSDQPNNEWEIDISVELSSTIKLDNALLSTVTSLATTFSEEDMWIPIPCISETWTESNCKESAWDANIPTVKLLIKTLRIATSDVVTLIPGTLQSAIGGEPIPNGGWTVIIVPIPEPVNDNSLSINIFSLNVPAERIISSPTDALSIALWI